MRTSLCFAQTLQKVCKPQCSKRGINMILFGDLIAILKNNLDVNQKDLFEGLDLPFATPESSISSWVSNTKKTPFSPKKPRMVFIL